MIAVTFALPAESSNFVRLLKRTSRDGAFLRGTFAERDLWIVHTGVGEVAARRRVAEFLSSQRPELLVSCGFAGALSEQLQIGDILLAQNYSAPALLTTARRLLPSSDTHVGALVTAAAIVDSVADRQELARASSALAVDMETQFIAEVCSLHAVPMLSIRAISDSPAAPLPVPADVMFDIQRQRTRYGALALHVAKDPGAFWRLGHFGNQIRIVRESLTDALEALLKNL